MQTGTDDFDRGMEVALEAHRAGRLDEAERLYLELMARHPAQPRPPLNLGAISMARRDFARAEKLFEAVLAREPSHAQAFDLLINALIGQGRFEDAERAIGGRDDPAARAAELRLRQFWAESLMAGRDFAGAEAQLRRVVDAAPQDPDAHNDLARLRLAAGRPADALATLAQALHLAPEHVPSLINQGSAFNAMGQTEEAEASYRRALAADPANVHAIRNLGVLLRAQGRAAEAADLEAHARAAGADVAAAHLARGVALAAAHRHEAALAAFRLALDHGGARAPILGHTGSVLAAVGRYAEALAALDEAAALAPDDPDPVYRRAFVKLLTRDFEGGWRDYEVRWRIPSFLESATQTPPQVRSRLLSHPTGDQLRGRRVTVIGEQGIGDQVMFASMLPDLAAEAAAVDCMCDDRLVRLFANAFPDVAFRGAGRLGETDTLVAMGSLGGVYRNREADFPGAAYLRPTPAAQQRWAERLGPRTSRLRLGLSWRGGTTRTRLHQRSIPLAALAPLLDLPDCEFVSVQYGDPAAELAAANAGRERPVRAFAPADIDDFDDLAGLVANLDLVVTVQTALAHLSGALGQPTLVMVPKAPEWRYTATGETTPWYGSVRLFRQGADAQWGPVIARVAEAVRGWATPV